MNTRKVERRRQRNAPELTARRMGVVRSKLDFTKFAYRWLNNTGDRVYAFTKEDDWDFVSKEGGALKDGADLGDATSYVVGTAPDGSALRAYLVRKPLQFYEDDQAEKVAELDRQLEQIRLGNDKSGARLVDYVPGGGINVAR